MKSARCRSPSWRQRAHLHLWAPAPLLEDALHVLRAWGFHYKSCFVWTKDQLGMGNYWRVSHELLLLGVRRKSAIPRLQDSELVAMQANGP